MIKVRLRYESLLNTRSRVETQCLCKFEEAEDNRIPECDAASSSEAWSFSGKLSWHTQGQRDISRDELFK